MKILICGSRDFKDKTLINQVAFLTNRLHQNNANVCIIEGGAKGADTIAGNLADAYGIAHIKMNANWDYYHKPAGPIRNGWMLKYTEPDLIFAFYTDKKLSKGTIDMVKQSISKGLTVVEVDSKTKTMKITKKDL